MPTKFLSVPSGRYNVQTLLISRLCGLILEPAKSLGE